MVEVSKNEKQQFMYDKKIEIGCEATHLITAVRGIVTGKSESLNGCIQFSLRQFGTDKEGRPFDENWLDEGILERSGEGLIGKIKIDEPAYTDIELGMTAKHFNGFIGVVTEKVRYFNGCIHFGLIPVTSDPNVMPETKYVPCQYLNAKVEEETVDIEKDTKGGPSSNAPFMT